MVSPAVYPRYVVIMILAIFTNTSRSTQLRISKPSEEHSRDFPEFPNQNLRKIGSVMIGQTNSQIDKQRLQLYI